MPSPSLSSPASHINATLGAIVIAEIVTAVLYGVAFVQFCVYFYHNNRGRRYTRTIMSLLWLLSTVYVAFTSHAIYYYSVLNFNNDTGLDLVTWSLASALFIGALIEVVVTSVFAFKICKLSDSTWPCVFIVPPQVISLTMLIANAALDVKFPQNWNSKFSWMWYGAFGAQATTDFAIAITLCMALAKHRSCFDKTNALITALIYYSIGTCVLTSSVSLVTIITLALLPTNFVHIAFAMLLPMLIGNSLVALLNSKNMLRDMHDAQIVSVHFPGVLDIADGATPDPACAVHGEDTKDQIPHFTDQDSEMEGASVRA
ncbi:hypothetical protein PsYK624_101260 [Phanerochaete sordida]|uniref:DUF6534 domain-containing protein n=1 Tax=Phanerochaete sordida TaxID=48140 RepID=A0A9P3GGN7_9APHY|nr:hypothetical protein PsYK624_101260 [Phanerochaete sordida]